MRKKTFKKAKQTSFKNKKHKKIKQNQCFLLNFEIYKTLEKAR